MTTSPPKKPKLDAHEWLAVLTMAFVLVAIVGMSSFSFDSKFKEEEIGEPIYAISQEIEVFVEGSVENPGKYTVSRGSLVKDALEMAIALPDADLTRLNLGSKLRRGRVVKVPSKEKVTVILKGAVVKPGEITLSKGARLKDLASFVAFDENADIQPLNKKRLLKDGETIWIGLQKQLQEL